MRFLWVLIDERLQVEEHKGKILRFGVSHGYFHKLDQL